MKVSACSSLPNGVIIAPMSQEMITAVARIHTEAFAGYTNTRLGSSYIKAFLAWFLTAERAIALVALDCHQEVVGYVLGAPIDYGKAMNRDLFKCAAVGVLLRPWLFLSRKFWTIIVARISSIIESHSTKSYSSHEPRFRHPEHAMSLIAIGVAPTARGKKVGMCLLRGFEEKARELGAQSLQLTVYPNNAVARKLYDGCGWMPLEPENSNANAIEYFRILTDDPRHRSRPATQS